MPRAKNPKTIVAILDASFRLFDEKGYDATSYADIARESGLSRTLVQKYFPKKGILALKNLARIRHFAERSIVRSYPLAASAMEREFLFSQVYIAALMSCEGSRLFFKDVLRDRDLTFDSITGDTLWTVDYLRGADISDIDEGRVLEDSTAALGALYEVAYLCIITGREMDVARHLKPCFENLSRLSGRDLAESALIATSSEIPSAELKELGASVYREALESTWDDCFEN